MEAICELVLVSAEAMDCTAVMHKWVLVTAEVMRELVLATVEAVMRELISVLAMRELVSMLVSVMRELVLASQYNLVAAAILSE